MLDGESFSLSACFADGKTLRVHGNNAFPEGYREGVIAINVFFEIWMEKKGITPWNEEMNKEENE